MDGEDEQVLADDDTHPIPKVGTIDVTVALRGGGAHYGLVIASPMNSDVRSRERLLRKIENYINDFHSAAAIEKFGTPTPERSRIRVGIHRDSDPGIFSLLEECRPWLSDNGISLTVGYLASELANDNSDDTGMH